MESNYSPDIVAGVERPTVADAALESNYSRVGGHGRMLVDCSGCGFGEQLQLQVYVGRHNNDCSGCGFGEQLQRLRCQRDLDGHCSGCGFGEQLQRLKPVQRRILYCSGCGFGEQLQPMPNLSSCGRDCSGCGFGEQLQRLTPPPPARTHVPSLRFAVLRLARALGSRMGGGGSGLAAGAPSGATGGGRPMLRWGRLGIYNICRFPGSATSGFEVRAPLYERVCVGLGRRCVRPPEQRDPRSGRHARFHRRRHRGPAGMVAGGRRCAGAEIFQESGRARPDRAGRRGRRAGVAPAPPARRGRRPRQRARRPPGLPPARRRLDLLGLERRLLFRRGGCARLLRRNARHARPADGGAQLAAMVQHRPALGLRHRRPGAGPLFRRSGHRRLPRLRFGL